MLSSNLLLTNHIEHTDTHTQRLTATKTIADLQHCPVTASRAAALFDRSLKGEVDRDNKYLAIVRLWQSKYTARQNNAPPYSNVRLLSLCGTVAIAGGHDISPVWKSRSLRKNGSRGEGLAIGGGCRRNGVWQWRHGGRRAASRHINNSICRKSEEGRKERAKVEGSCPPEANRWRKCYSWQLFGVLLLLLLLCSYVFVILPLSL